MHYWARGGAEQISGIKCEPTKLPKGEKSETITTCVTVQSLAWERLLSERFPASVLLVTIR